MKYTPEHYEWENGDIVASTVDFWGRQVARRIGSDHWTCGSLTIDDNFVTEAIQQKEWQFIANAYDYYKPRN